MIHLFRLFYRKTTCLIPKFVCSFLTGYCRYCILTDENERIEQSVHVALISFKACFRPIQSQFFNSRPFPCYLQKQNFSRKIIEVVLVIVNYEKSCTKS